MKKALIYGLTLTFALTLTACGQPKAEEPGEPDPAASAAVQTASPEAAQPPKPQQRTLKELAECAEAGLPLTLEEAERLEAHRNRKKEALQDLKARAETDPAAAAELAQQRAQQSEAVKKSRQKMYADAAAGDPEAQARYERHLAARRENYRRKKQAEAEAAQAS